MKTFKQKLALILSFIIMTCVFTATPVSAKTKFVKLKTGKTISGKIEKKNKVDYYKLTIKKKSKVSFLAYNGNLEKVYNMKCKIYKDKALKKRVYKTNLRVTDTDMWCPYKTLKAGTYYITVKSKSTFKYYFAYDILPVK